MERRTRRTVSLASNQSSFDFDEAAQHPLFAYPDYQKALLKPRFIGGVIDFGVVAAIYTAFIIATAAEMPDLTIDRRVFALYAVGYLLLTVVYLFLFMLSSGQTPGMKTQELTVVDQAGDPLGPGGAAMRGFGYMVSILPLMLGFVWALVDPEHVTWADKVSGTFVKRVS